MPIACCLITLALAWGLTGTQLPAQMSGTYTVDALGTGERNFKDLGAASAALGKLGISGPVTVEIAAGTYTSMVNIAPITGTSSNNTVTFRSKVLHMAVVTNLLKIDNLSAAKVNWVVLDGLHFEKTSTVQVGAFTGQGCTDIEIKNCKFTGGGISTSGANGAARWNIHHCFFDTTAIGTAIVAVNVPGFHIHHNEFRLHTGGAITAIDLIVPNNPVERTRIYNNVITGYYKGTLSVPQFALRLDVARKTDVVHNTVVIDCELRSGPGAGRCIRIPAEKDIDNRVLNNIFVNWGESSAVVYYSGSTITSNGNLFYAPNNYNGVVTNMLLETWQDVNGQDKDSISADPKFISTEKLPTEFSLQPTSPALGKAVEDPSWLTDDFNGKPRFPHATIGAIETEVPSTFIPFGAGCQGTGGKVPMIGYLGDIKLGSTDFHVSMTNALGGKGVSAWLAVGASNSKTFWNGIPLPIRFGAGCDLLVEPQLLLLLPVAGLAGAGTGSSSLRLRIPNKMALKGREAYFQWAVVDPRAKGIGLAFSDGATLKL